MSRLNKICAIPYSDFESLISVVRKVHDTHVVYTRLGRFVYIQHFEGYSLRLVLSKEELVQIEKDLCHV